MDAALIGVVGSLAGVAVGAATQHFQASVSRRWALEDSQRQERRYAYGQFLSCADELHGAVIELMGFTAAPSAPKEVRQSKHEEITNTCRRLSAMSAALSLLADEVLTAKIAMYSARMILYAAQASVRKQVAFDEELELELAKRRIDLVRDMRNELAGKRPLRFRIRNLLPRRAEPSRQPTTASVPSPLQRLAGEDSSPETRE